MKTVAGYILHVSDEEAKILQSFIHDTLKPLLKQELDDEVASIDPENTKTLERLSCILENMMQQMNVEGYKFS